MSEKTLPAAVGSSAELGVISRDEWIKRYADRVHERSGCGPAFAREAARIGAEEYERQERGCGNAVVWWGGPSGANNTPEDEADEEMSYWDDDGA